MPAIRGLARILPRLRNSWPVPELLCATPQSSQSFWNDGARRSIRRSLFFIAFGGRSGHANRVHCPKARFPRRVDSAVCRRILRGSVRSGHRLEISQTPPRSGWLDERGRLKGGCPVGLDLALKRAFVHSPELPQFESDRANGVSAGPEMPAREIPLPAAQCGFAAKSKGKRQRAKGKNGGPHGVGRVPDLPSRLRAPAAIARHGNRQSSMMQSSIGRRHRTVPNTQNRRGAQRNQPLVVYGDGTLPLEEPDR